MGKDCTSWERTERYNLVIIKDCITSSRHIPAHNQQMHSEESSLSPGSRQGPHLRENRGTKTRCQFQTVCSNDVCSEESKKHSSLCVIPALQQTSATSANVHIPLCCIDKSILPDTYRTTHSRSEYGAPSHYAGQEAFALEEPKTPSNHLSPPSKTLTVLLSEKVFPSPGNSACGDVQNEALQVDSTGLLGQDPLPDSDVSQLWETVRETVARMAAKSNGSANQPSKGRMMTANELSI